MKHQKSKNSHIKFLAMLMFSSWSFFCVSQSDTLYIKRNNSEFADGIIYETVFKVQEDSFKMIGYNEHINAVIETGPVFIKENKSLSLVVKDTKYISLSTGQENKFNFPKKEVRYIIDAIDDYYEYNIHQFKDNELNRSFHHFPFNRVDSLSKIESWLFGDMTDSMPVNKNIKTIDIASISPPPITEYEIALRNEVDALEIYRKKNIEDFLTEMATMCSITIEHNIVIQMKIDHNGAILYYDLPRRKSLNNEKADCIDQVMTNNTINLGEIKVIPSARSGSNPIDILYTVLVKRF